MRQQPREPGTDTPLDAIDELPKGEILSYLRNPDGIANLLLETTETGDAPAEIVADVVNGMRADTKRMADALGVEMEVERMTPEVAADVIAGTVGGDVGPILEVFAAEEDRRAKLLRHLLDAEEYRHFERQKRAAMFSTPADLDDDL